MINAIGEGRPVRVLVNADEQQFVMQAESLWVKNDNVYAQTGAQVSFDAGPLSFALGQDPRAVERLIAESDARHRAELRCDRRLERRPDARPDRGVEE